MPLTHGNNMRTCYIIREHDGLCMGAIKGWLFADTVKKLYEKKFKIKFYISYMKPEKYGRNLVKNDRRKRKSHDRNG